MKEQIQAIENTLSTIPVFEKLFYKRLMEHNWFVWSQFVYFYEKKRCYFHIQP